MLIHPNDDSGEVTFRISTISVVPKHEITNCGISRLHESAADYNATVHGSNSKKWIHYTKDSIEDDIALVLHFWHVGQLNSVVILSATVIKSAERKKNVRDALATAEKIVDSIHITKHHRRLDDPNGEISMIIEEVAAPIQESSRLFKTQEIEWLQMSLALAADLSTRYGSGGVTTPTDLDKIYSRWLHETGEKEPPELIIDAVGAAFGEFLVDHHGFCWKVVIDEYGTEYAVEHPIGKNTAFPRSSVQKRIETGGEDFLHPIYCIILQQLEEAKKSSQRCS